MVEVFLCQLLYNILCRQRITHRVKVKAIKSMLN